MGNEYEQNLRAYAAEIKLVAQLKAQGVTPQTLEKKDARAAVELEFIVGQLDLAGVMPAVDVLAEKIRKKLEKPGAPPTGVVSLEGKTDFLDLVPVVATAKKTKSKDCQPEKIRPPWSGDSEPAIATITNFDRRRRALGSDAGHDEAVKRQTWRRDYKLPPIAPPWNELLPRFSHLTTDQIHYLKENGFHPERFKQPNMKSLKVKDLIELMLFRLEQGGML